MCSFFYSPSTPNKIANTAYSFKNMNASSFNNISIKILKIIAPYSKNALSEILNFFKKKLKLPESGLFLKLA